MSGSLAGGDGPDSTGRLFRGGSIYTLATLAQLGAGILVLPFLTRILNAEEYGTVTASLVVFTLLGVSIGLGLPGAISRAYFRGDTRDLGREGALALVWVTASLAIVIAAALELTGPHWSQLFSDIDYGTPLRAAVLAAVAYSVLQAGQSVIRADERPAPFVVCAVIATAGAQGFGLAGAVGWGVSGYMVGMGIGVWIAAALALCWSGAVSRVRFDRALVLQNLRIGVPTVPHSVALYVLAAGDRVVIERIEGVSEVARYHVAYLIGFIVILLAAAVNNAWSPIVFGAERSERWQTLADTAAAVIRVIAFTAAIAALLAPFALKIAAPPGYDVAALADITALVALSSVPYAWYLATSHAILWRGTTWWFSIVTPVVAAINIGLNIVLIPRHGLIAAGAATLVAYTLLALCLVAVVRRAADIPWRWRSIATSGLIAGGFGALAVILGDGVGSLLVRAALSIALAVAMAVVVRRSIRPPVLLAAP